MRGTCAAGTHCFSSRWRGPWLEARTSRSATRPVRARPNTCCSRASRGFHPCDALRPGGRRVRHPLLRRSRRAARATRRRRRRSRARRASRSGLVREPTPASSSSTRCSGRRCTTTSARRSAPCSMRARSRLLCERGRDAEAAEHALRGDLGGDPEVIELLTRVAHAALRAAAVQTAAALFEATVELAGDDAPSTLLLDYAHTLILDQQAAKSIAVSERLLSRTDLDSLTRAEALRALARGFIYTGAVESAAKRFDESAATSLSARPRLRRRNVARTDGLHLVLVRPRGDLGGRPFGPTSRRPSAHRTVATPGVRRAGDDVRVRRRLVSRGQRAGRTSVRSRPFGVRARYSVNHWGPLVTYGTTASDRGTPCRLRVLVPRGVARVRAVGSVSYTAFSGISCVETLIRLLRIDEAVDLVAR